MDPLKIAIIGTSGSGKTCFIAAMRWLGECGSNTRFVSLGANGDTKKYLDDLHATVSAGGVPAGTPAEFRLDFSEQYRSRQIDFNMRDFKGGILSELDSDSPLLQSWFQCDVLMVLIDIERIQQAGAALLDNLRDLQAVLARPEMGACEKRLTIVVTQADKGGFSAERHSSEDAEKYLEDNVPDFLQRVQACGFREVKCFLLASIGVEPEEGRAGESMLVPELEGRREWRPFGYEELFDWFCSEERARLASWLWAKLKPYAAALALLALCGIAWQGRVLMKRSAALTAYRNPAATVEVRARTTWEMADADRMACIEDRIEHYRKDVEEATEVTELQDVKERNGKFFSAAKLSEQQTTRVREIDKGIVRKLEEELFSRIKEAMKDKDLDVARSLIGRYQTNLCYKTHAKEVAEFNKDLAEDEEQRKRAEIATAIAALGGPENTERMKDLLDKVRNFKYHADAERREAEKAVGTMRKLMTGPFEITSINAGERLPVWGRPDGETYVLIGAGVAVNKDLKQYRDEGVGIPVSTTPVKSFCPQWNDKRLHDASLAWKPGQPIRVEWRRDLVVVDSCMASLACPKDDWVGLLRILQPQTTMRRNGSIDKFKNEPTITIRCEEFPDAQKDLERIEKYIYPGSYWNN